MIPLNVVHEDLPPLDLWYFDHVFENDPYFTTFSERSVDFAFLIFVALNCNLLSDELFDV